MRKRIAIFVLVVLAAPLLGLLVSAVVGTKLATDSFAQQATGEVCDAQGQALVSGAGEFCYLRHANLLLSKASAGLLVLTMLWPSLYASLAYGVGRSHLWLAHCFPWLVRPTMAGLSALLALQGLLVVYAGYVLGSMLTVDPALAMAVFTWCVLLGVGFAGTALLILIEAFRSWAGEPFPVIGIAITPEQLPELTARVARLAEQLNAKPPARIIVGLEPRAFVTSLPLKLRGIGTLPPTETLYLPACFLRALNEQQLNALIGHELAHFRDGDLAFTLRFAPSFRGLSLANESVSGEVNAGQLTPLWSMARLPGSFLVQGIALMLALAVNRVRRARELEADRVAASVSSREAVASALVKVSFLAVPWKPFRADNAKRLGSGRARPNLSTFYLRLIATALSKTDRVKLREVLLQSRLAHPTDTHPILKERIQALAVDPGAMFDRALEELMLRRDPIEGLETIERAITAIENDWMCIPGTPFVLDANEDLPENAPLASTGPMPPQA